MSLGNIEKNYEIWNKKRRQKMAYTDEEKKLLFEEVCLRLEAGETLKNVLHNEGSTMSSTLFYQMLRDSEENNNRYARAREIQAETMFGEMLEIADQSNLDVHIDDEGKVRVDGEIVQRSKLKVDTRKWVLSKLNPKRYGDKLDIESKNDVNITGINIKDLIEFKDK